MFSDTNWSKIFELPFKSTQESKFHWLQYQILHRICPTNQYLFKLKIKDSPKCSFCNTDIETLEHLFFECTQIRELWCDVEEWIINQFHVPVNFDKYSVMFGKYYNRHMYRFQNLILLVVKQYIFSCRYQNNPRVHIAAIKKSITDRIMIEKYLLLRNCRYDEYESHWQSICEKL